MTAVSNTSLGLKRRDIVPMLGRCVTVVACSVTQSTAAIVSDTSDSSRSENGVSLDDSYDTYCRSHSSRGHERPSSWPSSRHRKWCQRQYQLLKMCVSKTILCAQERD